MYKLAFLKYYTRFAHDNHSQHHAQTIVIPHSGTSWYIYQPQKIPFFPGDACVPLKKTRFVIATA